jgi:hypothetical protein
VFRVIQLAGPTAREAEEQVAKYIEEQVVPDDQRDLWGTDPPGRQRWPSDRFHLRRRNAPGRHGDHGPGPT